MEVETFFSEWQVMDTLFFHQSAPKSNNVKGFDWLLYFKAPSAIFDAIEIDQFRCIKIQPKTIDLSTRF